MANPLILTLAIDDDSQRFFNDLRKKHFPPERNFLDAHLSLFHQLPAKEPQVLSDLQSLSYNKNRFRLQVTDVVSIGNGVAFKIDSPELSAIHVGLQRQWQQWLIPQDKHKLWPHITIQNKVAPEVAKALLAELKTDFEPFEIMATGVNLWEYLCGPWKFMNWFEFK